MTRKTELESYIEEREDLNRILLEKADRVMKRFISLDSLTYGDGALNSTTKELLGLVASTALRCDDCIRYHLMRCGQLGVSEEEIVEALGIAMVVGGSITIPHIRRAVAFLEDMKLDRE
ncbi:MAG: carboxymuconolactone decarboxylase family protein [Candidatus Aegiribacteria sp.]|nr:carboxymuconolactone decarboxylase family protein [Candidatus Aegiribacteria sp.]MBD3294325.1 carboxymuconolactone decarboxylase family protein [Candidatus Fermentibacteria bacterium]